ncbi:hypothetical protein D9756_010416 [Leucocoprinus leucothites]|uniref:Cytochrome P450 n=1 Tax=Leucocoprinus leucothites TaxID=201217 RepID=A0A8H5FRC6_9AGAR|nr:hypothetical protein D9756_010416 [Leucoagaricus leucothites]
MILSLRDSLVLAGCILVHLAYRYKRKSIYPLPPGLPGWPIIGNALEIPQQQLHKYFMELGGRIGSKIFYLKAFNQNIVVINDVKIAQDLLDKRSALYSSRMKIDYFFPFMPYGEEWRNHRRIFQQYFSPKNMEKEENRTTDFVRKGLLPNLYETPENFLEHLLNLMGGMITATTYGVPIQRMKDPLVEYQEYAFGAGEAAATPGRFLVDIIPQLKYIPEWFPGAGFKTLGKQLAEITEKVVEETYQMTLKGIEDGTNSECFVSWSLETFSGQPNAQLQALRLKQAAGAIYKAGTDTRIASSGTFIMAMLLNPDVQRKAQAEIDAVTAPTVPQCNFEGSPEVESSAPTWSPHLTSSEDVYEGLFIPKETVVFANAYAMLHDEETFPKPEHFNPERFMNDDGTLRTDILDPETVATFGFGRRVCPGAQVALSTLYLIMASVLSLFDITPEMDSDGKPIPVSPEFAGKSIISQPVPFRCRITPRKGKNVGGLLRDYLGYEVI